MRGRDTMNFDEKDPRLSAYALGELDGQAKEEIAALVATNPDAARFVSELKETASWLEGRYEEELAVGGAPPLLNLQKPRRRSPSRALIVSVAAGLLLALGILHFQERGELRMMEGGGGVTSNAPRHSLAGRRLSHAPLAPAETKSFVNVPIGQNSPVDRTVDEAIEEEEEIQEEAGNTVSYGRISENPFRTPADQRFSTFAIDVDTAAYSNIRRLLRQGANIPKDAVRIEELINYFPYSDPPPQGEAPFSLHASVASCPWNLQHRLLRVALKAKSIAQNERPVSNLVFLLDVSGSMEGPQKLPLLKSALGLLVKNLREEDHVSIVVYAGASGVVLEPTSGARQEAILAALDRLQAGGSTNGGAGLRLAYDLAQRNFVEGGNNRVILATDGDFNVGITDKGELAETIAQKAAGGIFLSVFGFGMGNYKDDRLERIADRGNGNYAYIDSLDEARKVFVDQMGGTLFTVAKDVKIQIEFNPTQVGAYRLIGYENRLMAAQDFDNDKKDGGEVGAGLSVTALYELIPPGLPIPGGKSPKSRYESPTALAPQASSGELGYIRLRYKPPSGEKSILIERPLEDAEVSFDQASDDFRFSAAVAAFGLLLRDSENKGQANWGLVSELAKGSLGADRGGYRQAFLELVRLASQR